MHLRDETAFRQLPRMQARTVTDHNGLVIREVGSEDELLAVARLRYEVTVVEMGLRMRYADHEARTVLEPLDRTGHVFAAWAGDTVIGTVRTSLLREGDVGVYYEGYGIPLLDPTIPREAVSVTTRLAINKAYRGGRAALLLPLAAYHYLLKVGITHDVIDSRRPLVPFFERLGYLQHLEAFEHPEFGDVKVQVLAIQDEPHLAHVRSPFLEPLRSHLAASRVPSNVIF